MFFFNNGCDQLETISKSGNKTNFLKCILGCGTDKSKEFFTFLLNEIMSISIHLDIFLKILILPNFFSTV